MTVDTDRRARAAAGAAQRGPGRSPRPVAAAADHPDGPVPAARRRDPGDRSAAHAHLTRPLRELMAAIARATSSNAVIDVPHQGRGDEIGQLARTVRSLSEVRATLVTREAEADIARRASAVAHPGARAHRRRVRGADRQSLLGEIAGSSEVLRRALQDSAVRAQQVSQSAATAAAAVGGAAAGAQRSADASLRLEQVIGQINTEVRRVSVMATAATQEAVEHARSRRPADR